MNLNVVSSIEGNGCIVIPFFENEVNWAQVSDLVGRPIETSFSGKSKSFESIHGAAKSDIIFLLGLGDRKKVGDLSAVFRKFAFDFHTDFGNRLSVFANHLEEDALSAISLGITLATYRIGQFKSINDEQPLFFNDDFSLEVFSLNTNAAEQLHEGQMMGETQIEMMKLVDSPANIKTPAFIAEYGHASAKSHGYKAETLKVSDLEREGLKALLAVGQGSANPPVLLKLEYKPEGSTSTRPKVGLVGKGVTFDTGGISLKSSSNLHYMKSDMGGAAAVIGAIEIAAKLKMDIHIVVLVPLAENAIDAKSVRPSDVIGSYSGKTIEIIDTDAEGRLILADGLAYLRANYFPEIMIDVATLTGSSVQTFGYATAALFTNNDDLHTKLVDAGTASHERVWRLPLWDDYKDDIASDVADLRNYSGKPIAGAITAAKFLEAFIGDHGQWAHLDIAGVAFGDSPYSKMKSASGYGVKLLKTFFEAVSK
jgi:leucyl aminopeptidase